MSDKPQPSSPLLLLLLDKPLSTCNINSIKQLVFKFALKVDKNNVLRKALYRFKNPFKARRLLFYDVCIFSLL